VDQDQGSPGAGVRHWRLPTPGTPPSQALLIGYREREVEVCGKVGTGFDTTTLRDLHAKLEGINQVACPFNLPGPAPRFGQALTAARMKNCHWVKPVLVCSIRFNWT
jgi:bifunctional non-homologous end joining protein LigD